MTIPLFISTFANMSCELRNNLQPWYAICSSFNILLFRPAGACHALNKNLAGIIKVTSPEILIPVDKHSDIQALF